MQNPKKEDDLDDVFGEIDQSVKKPQGQTKPSEPTKPKEEAKGQPIAAQAGKQLPTQKADSKAKPTKEDNLDDFFDEAPKENPVKKPPVKPAEPKPAEKMVPIGSLDDKSDDFFNDIKTLPKDSQAKGQNAPKGQDKPKKDELPAKPTSTEKASEDKAQKQETKTEGTLKLIEVGLD
jgi:hypothetical protein